MIRFSYFSKLLLLALPLCACSGNQAFRINSNNDYTVGPGDVIRIELSNYREYNERLFVDFSGAIRTKAIGNILVTGFTINDLEMVITSKYSKVLIKPLVQVHILSRKEQAVYIAGKIKKPGIIHFKKTLTVAQSIRLAGGVRNLRSEYSAYVLRKKTDGGWAKFKVNLKHDRSTSKKGDGAFKLAPYDIVYVTKSTEMDTANLTYGSGFGTEI